MKPHHRPGRAASAAAAATPCAVDARGEDGGSLSLCVAPQHRSMQRCIDQNLLRFALGLGNYRVGFAPRRCQHGLRLKLRVEASTVDDFRPVVMHRTIHHAAAAITIDHGKQSRSAAAAPRSSTGPGPAQICCPITRGNLTASCCGSIAATVASIWTPTIGNNNGEAMPPVVTCCATVSQATMRRRRPPGQGWGWANRANAAWSSG